MMSSMRMRCSATRCLAAGSLLSLFLLGPGTGVSGAQPDYGDPGPRHEMDQPGDDRPPPREDDEMGPPRGDGPRDGRGRGERRGMRGEHRRFGRFDGEEGGRGGKGGRLGRYLEVVQSYTKAVQDPHTAVGFAALGVKEHFRRAGNPEGAIKELEPMLASAKDQKMRNILLFSIRQIYEEQRNTEKFLEINRQIMKENLGEK